MLSNKTRKAKIKRKKRKSTRVIIKATKNNSSIMQPNRRVERESMLTELAALIQRQSRYAEQTPGLDITQRSAGSSAYADVYLLQSQQAHSPQGAGT